MNSSEMDNVRLFIGSGLASMMVEVHRFVTSMLKSWSAGIHMRYFVIIFLFAAPGTFGQAKYFKFLGGLHIPDGVDAYPSAYMGAGFKIREKFFLGFDFGAFKFPTHSKFTIPLGGQVGYAGTSKISPAIFLGAYYPVHHRRYFSENIFNGGTVRIEDATRGRFAMKLEGGIRYRRWLLLAGYSEARYHTQTTITTTNNFTTVDETSRRWTYGSATLSIGVIL